MPAIYTVEWYEALRDLLNRNPDVESNAPPGSYDVLAEIRGDEQSNYIKPGKRLIYLIRFENRKCTSYRQAEDPPPRKQFDFAFEMPASVFEGIAAGSIDLIEAGLKGAIRITGDMRLLIKHAELVTAVYQVYARELETIWPKGKPAAPQAKMRAGLR